MTVRPVQHFSAANLEHWQRLSVEEVCRFVEDFRELAHAAAQAAQPKPEGAEETSENAEPGGGG